MSGRRIAGIVAAVSGIALLVVAVASAAVPGVGGMMPFGPLAYGMGPGSMGPGMMRPGHMGDGSAAGAAAIPGAPEVRVTATDFRYSADQIALPANAAVNLTFENRGTTLHDLTVPALGLHVAAPAGGTSTIGLRALPAGSYPAFCSVPGHADLGMRTLVVVR